MITVYVPESKSVKFCIGNVVVTDSVVESGLTIVYINGPLPITFIVIVPPLAEHVEFCLPIDTTEKPASACKYVLPLTEHNAESVTINAAEPGVNPVNVGLFEYVTNVVPLLPE